MRLLSKDSSPLSCTTEGETEFMTEESGYLDRWYERFAMAAQDSPQQTRATPKAGHFVGILPEKKKGRWTNPFGSVIPSALTFLKVLVTTPDKSAIPNKALEKLDETLPIVKPEWSASPDRGVRITWLGHACVYVEQEGVTILTDPMLSERCSPVQWAGLKRYRTAPCRVEDIPHVDICLISHDHYDHLDICTARALAQRFPKMIWYVPLGTAEWFRSAGISSTVIDMTWWDVISHAHLTIVALPSNHWCKRGVADDNQHLWASWAVLGKKSRFYFAGDTAYCDAFKDIGKAYGPFDIAALPIGAYEPRMLSSCSSMLINRWFMLNQHVDPEQSVQIHIDVAAKNTLGIHWGTFKLTWENYLEPPRLMKDCAAAKGLSEDALFVLDHGASRQIMAADEDTVVEDDMSVELTPI